MAKPILHAIAVNYFGHAHVATLVDSFRRQAHVGWRLTIADNSQSAVEFALLNNIAARDSRVEVLACPANLGYFGGARWVIQRPEFIVHRWTAVCNVDLELTGNDFVSVLATLDNDSEVVAPSIVVASTGRNQNPYMLLRPTRRSMRFRRFVLSHRVLSSIAHTWASRAGAGEPPQTPSKTPIYAAHGAFAIFNRSYFDQGGSFAHEPFLFAEEITIAEICRRKGMTIVYDPRLRVTHDEHQATGLKFTNSMWSTQKQASIYAYYLIARGGIARASLTKDRTVEKYTAGRKRDSA